MALMPGQRTFGSPAPGPAAWAIPSEPPTPLVRACTDRSSYANALCQQAPLVEASTPPAQATQLTQAAMTVTATRGRGAGTGRPLPQKGYRQALPHPETPRPVPLHTLFVSARMHASTRPSTHPPFQRRQGEAHCDMMQAAAAQRRKRRRRNPRRGRCESWGQRERGKLGCNAAPQAPQATQAVAGTQAAWGEQATQATQTPQAPQAPQAPLAPQAPHRQQRRKRHKWHKRQQQCKRRKASRRGVSDKSGADDKNVGKSNASGLGDMQSTQADKVA